MRPDTNPEDDFSSGFVGQDFQHAEEVPFSQVELVYESSSGYNRIFRCERFGRIHLFKALKEYYAGNDFYENALRKEFNIGYQLEHPNICRTLGWETLPGVGHGILLEYVDGLTLKEFMKKGKLTRPLAYKFLRELCGALGYLHSKQIVHRDLKPENILITHNGNNVKLIDFSLSDCDDYDILKLPSGTRYYIAPEALQENVAPNLKMDIYSLGVVIGEMAVALHDKQLAAVSRKCTQRKPERRYRSAAEVARDLRPGRRTVYKYMVVAGAVALLCGVVFGVFRLQHPVVSTSPVFGNSSGGDACRRLIADERIRLSGSGQKPLPADSLAFMQRLQATFEQEYPLASQRSSRHCREQWEKLCREAAEVLSSKR